MTISTTTTKAGPFNGNGSTTSFGFNFKVFDPNHLTVYHKDATGVITQLTFGTDYSVSLNANQDTNPGGTVTFPIPGSAFSTLQSGEQLSIVHCPPKLQLTDLEDGATFRAQTLEDMIDYLTILVQCTSERQGCMVSLDEGFCSFSNATLTLPPPTPGAHIGWDATGSGLTNYLVSASTIISIGPTPPGNPYAGMFWIDTSSAPYRLKIRNSANTAWTDIGSIEESSFESAAELLAKLKTVDGAGSGLDADLVRGLPADFTASLSGIGYQKLPSGLIIQWGYWTGITPNDVSLNTITFPTTFPNVCYGVYLTPDDVNNIGHREGAEHNLSVVNLRNASFDWTLIRITGTGTGIEQIGVRWLAIGY